MEPKIQPKQRASVPERHIMSNGFMHSVDHKTISHTNETPATTSHSNKYQCYSCSPELNQLFLTDNILSNMFHAFSA